MMNLTTILTIATAAAGGPSDYSTHITNPYLPLKPGARSVFRVSEGRNRVREVVRVTHRTKTLANGVEARVVTDVARTRKGVLVEKTEDYYAQAPDGTVWYFGEHTTAYKHGKPTSSEGSFEAGVDGAEGGIAMPAEPKPGFSYRQEYYKGHAEDEGRIVATGEQAETPLRHFRHVVMTRDTNPLEPENLEFKFYARGVGLVLAIDVSGGAAREDLVARRA